MSTPRFPADYGSNDQKLFMLLPDSFFEIQQSIKQACGVCLFWDLFFFSAKKTRIVLEDQKAEASDVRNNWKIISINTPKTTFKYIRKHYGEVQLVTDTPPLLVTVSVLQQPLVLLSIHIKSEKLFDCAKNRCLMKQCQAHIGIMEAD